MDLATKIDHTSLKPDCTEADILKLCQEAIEYGFYSVCVPPVYVGLSKEILTGSHVKTCTVVGFPFGYQTSKVKVAETIEAISAGADEIDVVGNISYVKSRKIDAFRDEISQLVEVCHKSSKIIKVIIETALLTKEEIKDVSVIFAEAGSDFVKTSTGFAHQGALVEDVIWMRRVLPETVKIKASGGIKTWIHALEMIEAGADRLGTSSGVKFIKEKG